MPLSAPRPYTMWCFGLSGQDVACISQCAGAECHVLAQEDAALRDETRLLHDEPTLFWIEAAAWDRLDLSHIGGSARAVPKVMVLDSPPCPGDLDRFITADAEHVLRAPLTPESVYKIMRRTLEVCSIHHDMGRMTRELLLHRELLHRKSEVLDILFEAEQQLIAATTISALLAAARTALGRFLPLRSQHAVLWHADRGDTRHIDIYLEGASPDSEAGILWQHMLRDAAQRIRPGEPVIRRVARHMPGPVLPPDAGCLLLLPLPTPVAPVGGLMLLLTREATCSRDQSLAINAVLARTAALLRLLHLPLAYTAREEGPERALPSPGLMRPNAAALR